MSFYVIFQFLVKSGRSAVVRVGKHVIIYVKNKTKQCNNMSDSLNNLAFQQGSKIEESSLGNLGYDFEFEQALEA